MYARRVTQTVIEAVDLVVGQPRQRGFVVFALERVFLYIGQRALGIARGGGIVRRHYGRGWRDWGVGAGGRGCLEVEGGGGAGITQVVATVGGEGRSQRRGEVRA